MSRTQSRLLRVSSAFLAVALLVSCVASGSRLSADRQGAASVLRSASKNGPVPVKIVGNPTSDALDRVEDATLAALNEGGSRVGYEFALKNKSIAIPGPFVLVHYDTAINADPDDLCRGKPGSAAPAGQSGSTYTIVATCGSTLLRELVCDYTNLCESANAMRAVAIQSPRPATIDSPAFMGPIESAVDQLAAGDINRDKGQ